MAFFRVFAVGGVIYFSWCGRRAALFSVGLFVFVFVCVFSFFSGFFWVPFWHWVLGAVLLFFSVWLFVCVFVFFFFYEAILSFFLNHFFIFF